LRLSPGHGIENERARDASSTPAWIYRNLIDLTPTPCSSEGILRRFVEDRQEVADWQTVFLRDPDAGCRFLKNRPIPGGQFCGLGGPEMVGSSSEMALGRNHSGQPAALRYRSQPVGCSCSLRRPHRPTIRGSTYSIPSHALRRSRSANSNVIGRRRIKWPISVSPSRNRGWPEDQ
jgi:hypothetical protein